MTTAADTGDGATFGIGTTTAGPFTAIGEVKNISLPEETTDAVDATHLGSGGVRDYIVGLSDGGELTIEFNFAAAAGYAALKTKHDARAAFAFEAEEPNGDTWGAACILTALKPGDMVAGEVVTGSATFKVSGALTYTAAA